MERVNELLSFLRHFTWVMSGKCLFFKDRVLINSRNRSKRGNFVGKRKKNIKMSQNSAEIALFPPSCVIVPKAGSGLRLSKKGRREQRRKNIFWGLKSRPAFDEDEWDIEEVGSHHISFSLSLSLSLLHRAHRKRMKKVHHLVFAAVKKRAKNHYLFDNWLSMSE